MLNTIILSYITFVYFGAFMLYLLMMVMGRAIFGRLASLVSVMGLGPVRGHYPQVGGILRAGNWSRAFFQSL